MRVGIVTGRVIAAGVAGLVLSLAVSAGASAQNTAANSAVMGRKLVDACVYDQYRRQGSSEGVVKTCQCAARKAGPSLQPRQVERLQLGVPLTGDVRDEIYKAMASCQ
ncbi:hypothetical protein [Amorphus sp. 3PC139-8]|uniref:hypothetical protein n=1 Tax=Amorphus sp. 3PC139-8 TaxID=2735676 RepID=UPI00345D3B6B